MPIDKTNVSDHVNLEGQGQHVRVKASLGELGRLLGSLRLLEDGLQRLERVLDRHDGGVIDGVRHCEICVRNWRSDCCDSMMGFVRGVNVSTWGVTVICRFRETIDVACRRDLASDEAWENARHGGGSGDIVVRTI